jgi:iron(III) transport system ATP-binding protein
VLTVEGLFTEYPNEKGQIVKAAQDVSFSVPEGHLFTLLGPSGCGKTTTLRSIAGLERPRLGEISVSGRVVYSSSHRIFVSPNRRGFGMVFQSYAIWPHMDVFQNAAFPLEVGDRRYSRTQIRENVMRVLTAVQLDHLADREATKLSGGQQQRLALARALVMEPALLLLDEPLSNLDAKLREKMRFELKRLQRELKITTVYVTHDQSEALALSHQIAVMRDGRIQQIGTPREVYERPANQFVADFVGTTNFIDAQVVSASAASGSSGTMSNDANVASSFSRTMPDATNVASGFSRTMPDAANVASGFSRTMPDATNVASGFSRTMPEDYYIVRTEIGDITVTSAQELRTDERIVISVRPEDVELSEARPQGDNVWQGEVDQKVFLGEAVDFQVKVGGRALLSRRHPTLRTPVGGTIFVQLTPDKCVVLKVA